jgi:hypothetical protein
MLIDMSELATRSIKRFLKKSNGFIKVGLILLLVAVLAVPFLNYQAPPIAAQDSGSASYFEAPGTASGQYSASWAEGNINGRDQFLKTEEASILETTDQTDPFFRVYLQHYWISGENYPSGAEITVDIYKDSLKIYDDSTQSDDDGYFYFDLWDENDPFELEPGQVIEIKYLDVTMSHTVKDLAITEVLVDEDEVHGYADAVNSQVRVALRRLVNGSSEEYAYRDVVAGAERQWLAEFAEGDIDYSKTLAIFAAEVDEAGGAATIYTWFRPFFMVNPKDNHIWGHNWPEGASLTVTIGADPSEPDWSRVISGDDNDGNFYIWNIDDFDIVAGNLVTVTDGDIVKDHMVTELAEVTVDAGNDTVSGIAAPGTDVFVDIYGGPFQIVTADITEGTWSAVFAAGDIDIGTEGNANQCDEDGDETHIYWYVPNPRFNIDPQANDLWGHDWEPYEEISITIDYAAGGQDSFTEELSEYGDFWINLWEKYSCDVSAGDTITLDDGTTTRTHVVMNLTVDSVNPAANSVSGYAEPNSDVLVEIHGHDPDYYVVEELWVKADGTSGEWIAQFSNPIGPGSNGAAEQSYDDEASTRIHWRAPNPHFMVARDDNFIWGHDWKGSAAITVTIDNAPAPFYPVTDEWGSFDLWDLDGYDIQVGDVVTVSDGDNVVTHTVTDIQITEIDEENSIIRGTAYENSVVEVEVHGLGDELHPRRQVVADIDLGAGVWGWEADFSVPGEGDCDCFKEIYIFEPGSHGSADELDNVANAGTRVHWNILNPHFMVARDDNGIWGHEWKGSAAITVTIDKVTEPFYPVTDEWGSFDLWDLDGYDIQVGDEVTVSDGDNVVTHTVTDIQITEIDEENSIIRGTAYENSVVEVEVHGLGDELHPRRQVVADIDLGAGVWGWEADFSVPGEGDCDCFKEIYIFEPGSHGSADELDNVANAGTRVHWHVSIDELPTRVGVHRDNTFYLDADGDLNFDATIDRYSNFGTPADIPVIGNWNGDGYDQIGIRRDNTFYLDDNDNMAWEYPGDKFGNFGVATDTVLIGDWNGDGSDQVGVWREGTFYLDHDGNLDFDPAVDKMYSFGAADGTPIIGDWNGDGKDQIGVRSGSTFYLDYDGDGVWNPAVDKTGSFGLATDEILIGDWNGDGSAQIGVHRDNTFYLDYDGDLNFNAAIDKFANFGTPDDIPIIGDWNGNGADQIGIRRGPTYYLDLNGNMAWEYPGDIFGNFGIATDKILLGKWGPGLE